MINAPTYLAARPCARCGGKVRYVRDQGCRGCARLRAKERRMGLRRRPMSQEAIQDRLRRLFSTGLVPMAGWPSSCVLDAPDVPRLARVRAALPDVTLPDDRLWRLTVDAVAALRTQRRRAYAAHVEQAWKEELCAL